jgi:hypothetical protein
VGEDAFALALHYFGGTNPGRFHRGDPNNDGRVDLADGITVFGYLFLHNPASFSCREASDANNDAKVDLSDGIFVISWLFLGGPQPPTPGPATLPCGFDTDPPGSAGDVGCESYSGCR